MADEKVILNGFGNEDLSHIKPLLELILFNVLTSGNHINGMFEIIHKSALMPANDNIDIMSTNKFATVYTINKEYVKVSCEEAMRQINYVKSNYINELINELPRKEKIKAVEPDMNKENYLKVRTGLLCDDNLFTEKELKAYEKIRKANVKKLEKMLLKEKD
jgi:hypothetical protein